MHFARQHFGVYSALSDIDFLFLEVTRRGD
jgi:hypothetical protein